MWEVIGGLLAGLGLFLYGMEQMTGALQAIAGDRLRVIIDRLTGNRIKALLTGAMVTAVIQSSSVTTVLVVGFVSAGIMSLANSVGVIIGANVGTTITAQIMAFKVTAAAPVMIFGGLVLTLLRHRHRMLGHYGTMILGLGLIFYGMGVMGDATRPLRGDPAVIEWIASMQHPLLGVLIGAVFTAVIQSSSATAGIVLVLAGQGLIDLEYGIAILLGAKVGTCVTAALASIGRPREAVQTAFVHVIYNVLGVLLWLFFINQLADLSRILSPASTDIVDQAERAIADAPRQLANAYTAFTVVNAAIFLPFTGVLALFVQWLVPPRAAAEMAKRDEPLLLDDMLIETPFMALRSCRSEQAFLATRLQACAARLINGVIHEDGPTDVDGDFDGMADYQQAIASYLERLAELGDLGPTEAGLVAAQLQVSGNLSNILYLLRRDLVELVDRRRIGKIEPDWEMLLDLQEASKAVLADFDQVVAAFAGRDVEAAQRLIDHSVHVEAVLREVDHDLASLLASGGRRDFVFANDLLETLRQLYHLIRQIAKNLIGHRSWQEATVTLHRPDIADDQA